MPVAPVVGAALIAGGASVVGSAISSNSASRAAQATTDAANQNNQTQLQIYNQQRADMEPWRQFGLQALGQLSSIYNLNWQAPQTMTGSQWQPQTGGGGQGGISQGGYNTGGGSLIQQLSGQVPGNNPTGLPDLPANDMAILPGSTSPGGDNALLAGMPGTEQPQVLPTSAGPGAQTGGQQPLNTAPFFASPDYNFRLNEGNRNLTNAFANTGNLDSGAAQRALLRFGQDTASGEFNNYVNRLASFSGVGQTATTQNNAFAQGYANNVQANNNMAAQGRASAYQQQGQAWQQGLGGLAGAGMWAFNNYGGK